MAGVRITRNLPLTVRRAPTKHVVETTIAGGVALR